MVVWGTYAYVPVVRTRDAEMKGLREVAKARLDKTLPVIEFTRSRRSKGNPSAAVDLSIVKMLEILSDRFFIADVTSLVSQTTPEIEALLDDEDGFRNWTEFVKRKLGRFAIPVVHLTDPFDEENFRIQISQLAATQAAVALRITTSYAEVEDVLAAAASVVHAENLVVLADAGYVPPDTAPGAREALIKLCKQAAKYGPALIAPVSSSFPSSVVANGYGEDLEGHFPLHEVVISEAVKQALPRNYVLHGDYACVHPLDFEGTVTAWVPRVDVPLNDSLFYHRYRRPAGGYVSAAQAAINDPRYVKLDCWGHVNILEASRGNPLGKSPSHWIAVRVNYHVNRQVYRIASV